MRQARSQGHLDPGRSATRDALQQRGLRPSVAGGVGGRDAGVAAQAVGLGHALDAGGTLGLHDLADPYPGYPELSQLEFFPTQVRYNSDQRSVWLEDISIVRVISLSSVSRFEMKPSWNFRLGATTVRDGGCDACLAGVFEIGGGFARSWFGSKLTLFGFAQAELLGSPSLQGKLNLPLRLGIGPLVGTRIRVGERFSSVLSGSYRYLLETQPRWTYLASIVNRFHFGSGFSLSLEVKKLPQAWEGSLAPLIYF